MFSLIFTSTFKNIRGKKKKYSNPKSELWHSSSEKTGMFLTNYTILPQEPGHFILLIL